MLAKFLPANGDPKEIGKIVLLILLVLAARRFFPGVVKRAVG